MLSREKVAENEHVEILVFICIGLFDSVRKGYIGVDPWRCWLYRDRAGMTLLAPLRRFTGVAEIDYKGASAVLCTL